MFDYITAPSAPAMAQLVPQPLPVAPEPAYRMTKLICSFKSGLPNEIDFAMQVAILLANTDNFTWSKDYPLVEAICSSLHVYTCICSETPPCYCYPRFWHKILNSSIQSLHAATIPPEQAFTNFANLTNHEPKDHAKIYKRVKMAAELIKQFSMTTGSEKSDQQIYKYRQKKLKASPPLLKFVSLLLHCSDAPFNFIGLDILSNTASKLSKVNNDSTCTKLVRLFQEHCLDSICTTDGDIYIVNRSIDVVSKLISSTGMIKLIIEKNLVLRLEQFLTSNHDVTLFLSALECCHKISRNQPHLLRAAKYSLKIFVNLLNCDDLQYFTPNALKRIKLTPFDLPPQAKAAPQPQPQAKSQPHNDGAKSVAVKNAVAAVKVAAAPAPASTQSEIPPGYTCQWDNCNKKFTEAKEVKIHVFETHIGPLAADLVSSCLWSGPNGSGPGCLTKRPKYSLLTHLNDYHCSQVALERPIKPAEHPGYAPNAALLAIRRHAQIESAAGPNNQSPLSVSVRLTAALILRNLATDSELKQTLKKYEPLLSEICMNGRDESKIVAECLSLL